MLLFTFRFAPRTRVSSFVLNSQKREKKKKKMKITFSPVDIRGSQLTMRRCWCRSSIWEVILITHNWIDKSQHCLHWNEMETVCFARYEMHLPTLFQYWFFSVSPVRRCAHAHHRRHTSCELWMNPSSLFHFHTFRRRQCWCWLWLVEWKSHSTLIWITMIKWLMAPLLAFVHCNK